MVWLGVHKELTREHHGRRLGDLPLQPIVLSVLTEEETQEIHKITSAGGWFALRCKRTARLFKEADDQGTTLPYADIAALYDQGLWTIKRDVQTWEKQQGQHLPHRGFVHESASPRLIRPKSWKASCKASKFRKPLDCIIIMCTTWNAITRGTMRSKWRWGSPMISI
jgi:hypothetical protein